MTPVDSFLHSVRYAFQPSYGDAGWILAAVVLAVLSVVLFTRWRAKQARRRADQAVFAQLLLERELSAADGQALVRLAGPLGVSPVQVATHLDVFERATARELAELTPTAASGTARPGGGGDDPFARIHRLRRTLGFHVVPEHLPLVTTRELVPGTHLEVTGIAGEVLEVNEAWFVVVAAANATFLSIAAGAKARVTFTRDARYVARCAWLHVEPVGAPRKIVFRHDEHPERQQLRATVRVSAEGKVELAGRPVTPPGDHDPTTPRISCSLIDISLGGLAMSSPVALAVGSSPHVAIEWDGELYSDLSALILRCDARPGGRFLARLEFRGLGAAEEGRLSAAIARHSARIDEKPADDRSPADKNKTETA